MILDDSDSVQRILVVATPQGGRGVQGEEPEDDFKFVTAGSIAEGAALLGVSTYDAVVLTVASGGASTVGHIHSLRLENPRVPLLVHAGEAEDDEIEALIETGADDWVIAPISPQLLRTRLRVLLRRTRRNPAARLAIGNVFIDERAHVLIGASGRIHLTPKEYSLLAYLISAHGSVISRGELLSRVWGYTFDPGTSVLDVTIGRVRRKLERVGGNVSLRAVRSVGYVLELQGETALE